MGRKSKIKTGLYVYELGGEVIGFGFYYKGVVTGGLVGPSDQSTREHWMAASQRLSNAHRLPSGWRLVTDPEEQILVVSAFEAAFESGVPVCHGQGVH